MRELIVKCDACGKKVGDRGFRVVFGWESATEAGRLDSPETDGLDFCEACMKDIQRMVFRLTAPEEPARAEQKRVTGRPKVDRGKVKALHDAGWSPAKIADEMGCSYQIVYRILEKFREVEDENDTKAVG